MAKKIFKSLMLGIIIFSVAVLSGYVSYVVTYRQQNQMTEPDIIADTAAAAEVSGSDADTAAAQSDTHYIARLENDNISIYINSSGKESFLYTLGISPGELSSEDIRQLEHGIVLEDRRRLAAFEEDFTS